MDRLIDTMNANELNDYLDDVSTTQGWLPYKSDAEVRQKLERLFAKEPHWSDNLDPTDNQTWVLCYISDDSAEETWHVEWVSSRPLYGEGYRDCVADDWKYATPVDLNARYKKGESDD
jgi:hypothetical protein